MDAKIEWSKDGLSKSNKEDYQEPATTLRRSLERGEENGTADREVTAPVTPSTKLHTNQAEALAAP